MIFMLNRAIVNDKTIIIFNVKRCDFSDKLYHDVLLIEKICKVVNCLRIGSIYLLTFICSKCFSESNSLISSRTFSNNGVKSSSEVSIFTAFIIFDLLNNLMKRIANSN